MRKELIVFYQYMKKFWVRKKIPSAELEMKAILRLGWKHEFGNERYIDEFGGGWMSE
jgi:hypothetical protein